MEFENYQSYNNKYGRLVQLEREEEMNRHMNEIKNLSGVERQNKGRAILGLRGKEQGREFGELIVKFVKDKGIPRNEISVGDLVMVSKNKPLDKDNPTGTVIESNKYTISVAFSGNIKKFIFGKGLRIDLYVNDITFQRMIEALENFKKADGRKKFLRDLILGKEKPNFKDASKLNFINKNLDKSQKEAVKNSLESEDIFLIHGPPGTGKTTTVIEVIEQHLKKGEKVLATADSNVAVDNMVDFLTNKDKKVVRVGHPARVTKNLREHTLDFIVKDNGKYKRAGNLREEVEELNKEQEDEIFPSGKNRRGLSNEEIKRLAKDNKSSRGLPPGKIKAMAEWIRLQDRINEMIEKAKELERKAVSEIIWDADVVCTTNSTAGGEILKGNYFGLVVIDEATQATEPSCLIPLQYANKIVMAGDHKQLPPTILNKEAQKGLSQTLFERLLKIYREEGNNIKYMLKTQYRMNKDIMQFSSENFYNSELKADKSVVNHKLDTRINSGEEILNPDNVIVFVDIKSNETTRNGSTSKENNKEVKKVKKIIDILLDKGITPCKIGIISPYDDQIDLLKKNIPEENIEIKTVDGFQGREKDIITLSFVRANSRGEMGFLTNLRRLNVSITRARKKFIMVGNKKTLENNETYRDLIEYTKNKGIIVED